MPIVRMPNGDQVRFPDDMPREQIRDMIASKFPELANTRASNQSRIDQAFDVSQSGENLPVSGARSVGAAIDGISQGATFGFSDEIAAGLATATGLGGDFGEYDKNLAAERIRMEQNSQAAPVSELMGQVAGGVLTGAGLAKNGLLASTKLASNAGLGARTATVAADGAIAGALSGAGNAEENRLAGAGDGALIGAATGAVVGNVLGRVERSNIAKQIVPTTDDLKQAAHSLYEEAEKAGATFSQTFYNRFVSSARHAVGRTHAGLHPKTQAALEVLENERGRTLSLSEVDELRQVISNSISGADKSDARLLGKIVSKMDSYVKQAKPSDLIAGSREGIGYIREARNLWAKQAKSSVLDEIAEKARNQATGFENGLRIQFRSLANNPKKFAQFDSKEQAAIKRIVRGGPIENTLRAIGWLDPRGVFGALLTGGTVTGVGAVPAGLMAGAGFAGKKGAEVLTRSNVDTARRLITTGSKEVPFRQNALPSVTTQTVSQSIQANDLLPPMSRPRER